MSGMNRSQRRQAAKEFQAQLASGAVDLAEVANQPKKLYLGYVTGDTVATAWHRSILRTAAQSQQFGFVVRPRDAEVNRAGQVPYAKNLLLKSFLETEDDYLLFVDTNIAFAPQDVAMLLATDAAIAGALYFSAASGSESQPQAWVESEDGFAPVALPKPPEDFNEADQEQLEAWMATLSVPIPVAGVGLGLCLVSRATAEAAVADFVYPFEAVQDRSEDLTFCLRAAPGGTVVLPSARVGFMQVGML